MTDRKYRHPVASYDDATENVLVPVRDESDGTFSPVLRARLEAWDGSSWVRTRANANGALLLDRGGAGADLSISVTFTTAATNYVLLATASAAIAHVTAAIVATHNSTTASPAAEVKIGTNTVFKHPGIPGGGGIAATDMDIAAPSAGDDITFTCDAPTGGSLSVTVHYYLE